MIALRQDALLQLHAGMSVNDTLFLKCAIRVSEASERVRARQSVMTLVFRHTCSDMTSWTGRT